MKKLFTCFLICTGLFSLHAEAQSSSIVITNHSPCPVTFQLGGSRAPSCTAGATKAMVTLAAFSTVTYSGPNAVPIGTLSATDYIIYARIWDQACGGWTSLDLTTPCALPGGTLSGSILVFNTTPPCVPCGTITAVWTPGPIQALDFY